MEKTAKLMYKIGKILAIIGVVFSVILTIVSVYGIAEAGNLLSQIQETYPEITTVEQVVALFATLAVVMGIGLILEILMIIFGNKASAALGNGEQKPQVIALVLAILSGQVFYFIGGILGLVLANKKQTPQQVETSDNSQ